LRASIAHENEALTLEKKDSAELDGKLTKALEQVSYLSAKLAQQQEVEDHLKLAVVNLERELSSTRDRSNNLEQLEKQLTANNEYNLGLVADKEARIIELNKMIIELEVTRDELKLQSQQLESSITELKENLKQKDDNNLTETFAELEIANGNVTRLEAELDALRAEHTRQAEEMDSIRSASEVIVKELSSKFHELQDAFIASQNERMELAQNAEKTDARIRDAEIQLAKAEKKNGIIQSVAEAKYAAFQKEVEDLKAENARLVQTTTPQ
jgi:chromosome segregation ATPase